MSTFRGQEEEDKDLARKTEKKHLVRREKNQMVWSPESREKRVIQGRMTDQLCLSKVVEHCI